MEVLWVLNGLLIGVACSYAWALYIARQALNAKTKLLNDQLTETLGAVVESHNTLNKTIAAIDKRATETSLRVDNLTPVKPKNVTRFPGIV